MANPKVVTGPTHLPLTMDEVKHHLRIELDDNTELAQLDLTLKAAVAYAQTKMGRKLVTQTLDAYYDHFPEKDYLELPGGTLQSITSLKYTDSDNTETTWGTANYFAVTTHEPGWLQLAYGISWPSVTLKPRDAIVIRYIVGEGTGDQVSDDLRAAILLLVGEMWENREDSIVGQGLTPVSIPRGADRLMAPHKLWSF